MEIGTTANADATARRHERVQQHLTDIGVEPQPLDLHEVKRDYPDVDVRAAWRINLEEALAVDVLIGPNYPYEHALIGVAPLRAGSGHVYTNNTLCLLKPQEAHVLSDNEEVLDELMTRARATIAKGTARGAVNPEEVVDYWKGSTSGSRILLVGAVSSEPHQFHFARVGHSVAVADAADVVAAWVSNHTNRAAEPERSSFLVAGLDFNTRISTPKELYDWFAENRSDQVPLLVAAAEGARDAIPLIVAIPGASDGTALLASWVRKSVKKQIGRINKVPGFRSGTAPGHVAAPYIYSPHAVLERARVKRVDAVWLTERGGTGSSAAVRTGRVVLIGCGSLGSTIARLLVKSGVSRLAIIDPQILEWDNIARHELGGRFVGQSKAEALASELRKDFPHIEIEAMPTTWQRAYEEQPELFRDSVVVSTTADPTSDVQLNDVCQKIPGVVAVIFAWLEPFAGAAQALVVAPGGGCLRCACDECGTFKHAVTDWEGVTVRHEPGCALNWQPYAELEAIPAKAFVADIVLGSLRTSPAVSALHSWVGPERTRKEFGGTLRPAWTASHGESADNATYTDLWECACSTREAVA